MIAPNWILGGILAGMLGLTGLAASSETPAQPEENLVPSAPAVYITASLPVVPVPTLQFASQAASIAAQLAALHRSGALPSPPARSEEALRINAVFRKGEIVRPIAREDYLPKARWDERAGTLAWTEAAMSAINEQNHDLSDIVPIDIDRWCPAYTRNNEVRRDSFWVGMISTLARHESTFNPSAVGGGGLYHGLFQILPSTAEQYGCSARTGQELHDPEANLSCAIRIMSVNVARDHAVAFYDGRWRGVAADWGPMTNSSKREEMQEWTRSQSYCAMPTVVSKAPRPPERPWLLAASQGDDPTPEVIELALLTAAEMRADGLPGISGAE
jgi:hypothetical protein